MKFAIVIPAYKAAATIAETLAALAAQPDIQEAIAIYLVNDCSPDNQVEVAQAAWTLTQPPLEVITPAQNGGVWRATNIGIERARDAGAEWVLFMHADDLAKPDWMQTLLAAIRNAPAHVASVCSSYDLLYPDGRVESGEHNPKREYELVSASDKSVRDTLLMGCWWHVTGGSIRVAAYEDISGFDPRYYAIADWDWSLRLLNSGWDILYIPLCLIYYRQHVNTITAQTIRTRERVVEQVEIIERFGKSLSLSDTWRWHTQQAYFALRRIGRDVLTRNLKGFITDARSMGLILTSGIRQSLRRRV
jgi:GT2 family glycosyltransferase